MFISFCFHNPYENIRIKKVNVRKQYASFSSCCATEVIVLFIVLSMRLAGDHMAVIYSSGYDYYYIIVEEPVNIQSNNLCSPISICLLCISAIPISSIIALSSRLLIERLLSQYPL
jgi:hypothetical protein